MTIDTTVTNGRFVGSDGVFEHSISIHEGRVLDAPEFDDVWRTIDASGHLVFPGLIQRASSDLLALVRRGTTTVIGGDSGLPMDYLPGDGNRHTIAATDPDAVQLARAGNAMIELAVQLIEHDPGWWQVVADESLPVHVTCGDNPSYPLLQYLYHVGGDQCGLKPERVAAVTSVIPARWYGMHPNKGSFATGSHGDVLVFDPHSSDPYHDDELPGRIIMSIQRGEMLLYNGQVHAATGSGVSLFT